MALDESQHAEAQAAPEAKRRELGIPERASPIQEQSPSAGNTGDTAPDPEANLNESAKRFLDSFPDAERERVRKNLTKDTPSEEITPGRDAAARRPTRSRERGAKTRQTGKSWGMLFVSLVATPEFQSLRARNLHVLCALIVSRDNQNGGECAPGFEKIIALTGFAPRTIDRSLLELVNLGIIRQARKAHVGQNASYLIAEDGGEITRNQEAKARH